ncbi:MAG: ABC transporter permease [Flavobacteriales bacterium]
MIHDNPSRWSRFRRNSLAMGGMVFILCCLLVVLSGPFIRPDDTVHANHQQLAVSRMKPMSTVSVVRVPSEAEPVSWWKKWVDGGADMAFEEVPVSVLESSGDLNVIVPLDLADTTRFAALAERSDSGWTVSSAHIQEKKFILGTDKYGRDVLSRLMAGTAVSLSVGAIAVLISLLVGLTLGLLAGYYRGWVDAFIMWFTNVVWAVPTLLLVMAITFAFGTGFWKVFLAVGLTMWVEVARITRGQVLSVREKEYVEAARAIGLPDRRIIFRHILPNILSPIIVISAANFASAILIEAGLSFLGLGAQIPTPSWGNMIREHYAYLTTDLAYLAIVPGVMIMLLVLSFMMIGNGLRDALDVRR